MTPPLAAARLFAVARVALWFARLGLAAALAFSIAAPGLAQTKSLPGPGKPAATKPRKSVCECINPDGQACTPVCQPKPAGTDRELAPAKLGATLSPSPENECACFDANHNDCTLPCLTPAAASGGGSPTPSRTASAPPEAAWLPAPGSTAAASAAPLPTNPIGVPERPRLCNPPCPVRSPSAEYHWPSLHLPAWLDSLRFAEEHWGEPQPSPKPGESGKIKSDEAKGGTPAPPPSPDLTLPLALAALAFAALTHAFLIGRRLRSSERSLQQTAKALGLPIPATDTNAIQLRAAELRAADDELRALTAEPRLAAPNPAPLPRDPNAGAMLAEMAQYWLRALDLKAEELGDDSEFCAFYDRLDLREGARRAATALEASGASTGAIDAAAMYNALVAGRFDTALTSLDVLAAYARPKRDWGDFLVCLEAAEAMLSLALFDCGIRLCRPALMTPMSAASLAEIKPGYDRRGLSQIPSARNEAAKKSEPFADSDEVLLFDCYSPGWISDHFDPGYPVAAFYDPASMSGAAL